MFAPIARGADGQAGRFAIGRADSSGEFTLGTYEPGDGAIVGEHWVTIIHAPAEEEVDFPSSKAPAAKFSFDRLSVPNMVTVVAGGPNRIDIAVTADEVRRLGTREE